MSYVENILAMMFNIRHQDKIFSATMFHALDAFLILHADHEHNASTASACISPATGSLLMGVFLLLWFVLWGGVIWLCE